ncbi:MAG: acyl-CoA thioester hydrolase [Alphaproteobacteria bacterium]|nr:acyl-CoA thioester hydrolase [Alphaproteobacteria bacterium]
MQQPTSKPPRAAPPRPEDFPVRVPDLIRYGDLDRQGHVNNAVYSTYLETGRVAIIWDAAEGLQVPGATSVLARVEIDFLKELRWPGTLEIGTGVAEIGRSSYVFTQAIFHDGVCAAKARSTMVLIDGATRRARALPPELAERLGRLALRTG